MAGRDVEVTTVYYSISYYTLRYNPTASHSLLYLIFEQQQSDVRVECSGSVRVVVELFLNFFILRLGYRCRYYDRRIKCPSDKHFLNSQRGGI